MKLIISSPDPLLILTSTKKVVESARLVKLSSRIPQDLINRLQSRFRQGLETDYGSDFLSGLSFESDLQMALLMDSVNFCFWADKDQPKWYVAWPKNNQSPVGGWYSLVNCFRRALANHIPILETDYLINLTIIQVNDFFRSDNQVAIPLLLERQQILQDTGRALKSKGKDSFYNLIKQENEMVKIAGIIKTNFPSFRDEAVYQGQPVFFYKRLQLLVNDIGYIYRRYHKGLNHLEYLTAYADYKLPQLLRHFGVIKYAASLANRIDKYQLIPFGSPAEIEIRSATIWAVELLKSALNNQYTSAQIDNALWLLSQEQVNTIQPYHRTYTINY